jgi:predicted glycosyltransferase
MEIIQAQIPALVVPFAAGGEDEQLKRARRLETLGAMRVLEQKELTPRRLADEIRNVIDFEPSTTRLNFDGARRSTEILHDLLERRRFTQGSHFPQELVRCVG